MAVVIDGVQQIHPSQFTQELFDIESIEVLRGPQGALYGRNASGGAIIINTVAPSNETQGQVGLRVGKNSEAQIQGSISGSIVEDKWFYRIGARYREVDGYLNNAFLNTFMDPVEDTTFRASLRYEGRVRLNGAIFKTDIEGFFYFAFIPQTGDEALINIDHTEILGGELELFASVTENFSVNASIGVSHSEIQSYTPDPTTVGNSAPYVAKNTFNVGAQYRFEITPDINWFTRVDFERRGEQFWDPENTSSRSPINFLSAGLGIEGSDNKWSVIASGTNLLDEEFNSEYVGGLFPGIPHRGLPLIWSVDFQYNW